MLLLPLAGHGVLVTEDEVDLVGGTALVGTKHDGEGGLVGVVFTSTEALVRLGQELDVSTTAFQTLLELDLVLDDEGLALGVDGLGEEGRDGVVGGL